jgi:hypothetical protein
MDLDAWYFATVNAPRQHHLGDFSRFVGKSPRGCVRGEERIPAISRSLDPWWPL